MENCEYTGVFTETGTGQQGYDKNTWKPLLRQIIISFGVCCAYFLLGVFQGAPTIIVAQTRRDTNSTESITDEMLSWLTSTLTITSLPATFILPLLYNRIGRKLSFSIMWLLLLIGFIIFYTSTNLHHVIISEVLAGLSCGFMLTITPILIAEYTSPQYRGIFMTLKSASVFWGIWVANAIGTFFYWKNIALVAFVCSVFIISLIIWPESPHWLAMNGRYGESAKSHRWLKGVSEKSERELAQLITSQKKINNLSLPLPRDTNNLDFVIRDLWSKIKERSFYKPALLSLTLFAQYQFSGKFVISLYAIDVLKHLIQDESLVYKEMLILDGITVFSMYLGCILSRYFKRRTLMLLFSTAGILLLYILSLYTYLIYLSILKENHILLLVLLSAFSIAIGCGPIIFSTSIYGEIISPRYQTLGAIVVGSGAAITMSLLLKLSPLMFKTLKMHGCFLFFAVCSTIFLSIIYIYLPETKDKTIQEIEKFFTEIQLPLEPSKTLLNPEKRS